MPNATRLGKVYGTVLNVSKPFVSIHLRKNCCKEFEKLDAFLLHFSQLISAGFSPAPGHVFNLRTSLEEGGARYRQT
jgi:hypothetical protein